MCNQSSTMEFQFIQALRKTKLLELEMNFRRLFRINFEKPRMDWITELLHDNKVYTVTEIFAYDCLLDQALNTICTKRNQIKS